MRALVTGASGAIGSSLTELLRRKNIEVITWNRNDVPINDYEKMEAFIYSVRPNVLFHLAIASGASETEQTTWNANYEWTSELAWITKVMDIRFLFTSTNLVFSNRTPGPYTIHSIPDAESGYGFEKRNAEERIFRQNPNAIVVRLGWQIGSVPGSNNMIDYLERKMKADGEVRASIFWKPACSMLEDTCEKIIEMGFSYSPGLYMIDSNERWNFFQIAKALNHLHGHCWKITSAEDYVADTRMIDSSVKMISLKDRLNLP